MAKYNIDVNIPHEIDPDPINSEQPRESMRRVRNIFHGLIGGSFPGDSTVIVGSEGVASSGTITLATCLANTVVEVNGVDFLAVNGTATSGNNEFDMSGTDTADAAALAAAINASTISDVVTATSALGVVTVTAKASGKAGNAVSIKNGGVRGTGTVTYVTPSGAQTIVINGVTVYNATAGATAALTATAAAAAINASADALVAGHVKALARAGVCFIYAVRPGAIGNTITLTATGTGATASAARLAGGTEVSTGGGRATGNVTLSSGSGLITITINGVAAASETWATSDTATAALLVADINNHDDDLIRGVVYAWASAGVVNISAHRGGTSGNTITIACSGTGATASGARLATGAAPTTVVPSAERLASGTATYTTFSR